ncbi:YbhB/YbcL family Raf kinase inhibitor-like protein [Denitratisoma sp. DHT3]|uniref:YbhB/YbcL family Raf kinase inhibitor-like protein n=1 Tax=Denitratisoma sp. DHT3 TaxID=1981880 RepID=UPI0021BD3AE6|nr:YbhB/YbcL family Raf kinase inhibitor-like protein [Denitratisoma sp. DHT3]
MTASSAFVLRSPDLSADTLIPNKHVYNGFGYTGENVSPALEWRGAPADTKSFALTVHDPDAPTGSGWWHWVLVNIPAGTTALPQGAGNPGSGLAPAGSREIATDFGEPGWGGPCPPQGDEPHRYVFTIHALGVERLDLPENATPALVGFNLHFNTLAKASFTARYGRK